MSFTPEVALDYLRRAHSQDRLAHAYLISGDAGSGKRKLAAELTALVNGAAPEAVFSTQLSSDVQLIEPASKSRRIVIEQIRELEHALQMRATDGRRKVGIISDADRLQPQAANAFLKTLEEPPNDSLLLLLSALPEILPDTIISRCLTVHLTPNAAATASPEERELIDLLGSSARENFSAVQRAYRLGQGFQRLLSRIKQTIQEENAAALKRDEARYKNSTDGSWLDRREDHYKALAESLYLQQRARLLDTLFLWWSDVLRASIGVERSELTAARAATSALAATLTTPEILRRLRKVEELRDHLGRNIQEALAIEATFLAVFAL